jgi:hypothetical protein
MQASEFNFSCEQLLPLFETNAAGMFAATSGDGGIIGL